MQFFVLLNVYIVELIVYGYFCLTSTVSFFLVTLFEEVSKVGVETQRYFPKWPIVVRFQTSVFFTISNCKTLVMWRTIALFTVSFSYLY